jgi:hypothetical protein
MACANRPILVTILVLAAIPATAAGRTANGYKPPAQKCATGRVCTAVPKLTQAIEGRPRSQASAPYPCLFYMC